MGGVSPLSVSVKRCATPVWPVPGTGVESGASIRVIATSDGDTYNRRMNRTMNAVHESTPAGGGLGGDHRRQVDRPPRPRSLRGAPPVLAARALLGGISPRTLAERLRALEGEGIVERHSYPESPPRVEYELTEKGEALLPIIDAMRDFGHSHLTASTTTRTA